MTYGVPFKYVLTVQGCVGVPITPAIPDHWPKAIFNRRGETLLIPHVPFINFESVLCQHRAVFILKSADKASSMIVA